MHFVQAPRSSRTPEVQKSQSPQIPTFHGPKVPKFDSPIFPKSRVPNCPNLRVQQSKAKQRTVKRDKLKQSKTKQRRFSLQGFPNLRSLQYCFCDAFEQTGKRLIGVARFLRRPHPLLSIYLVLILTFRNNVGPRSTCETKHDNLFLSSIVPSMVYEAFPAFPAFLAGWLAGWLAFELFNVFRGFSTLR